eukprot:jgi/Chrzof1/14310/Cz08g32160.t1
MLRLAACGQLRDISLFAPSWCMLLVQAWKEHVLPLLRQHIATEVDPVLSYILVYHEASLANLLEVTLYHSDACECVGEDELLELADWCYRKLQYLNTDAHQHAQHKDRSVQETLAMTPLEELEEKQAEVDFGTAMCALTILRYLTDYLPTLPMGLLSRLVSTNDSIMALLPLVDKPPWVRTRKGKMERFTAGVWQAMPAADRLKLCQPDAQVWLALNNLLVDPKCRAKYEPDDYRRENLLKLKRHFHEVLLDQLPVLKDLQHVLDEMAMGIDAAATDQHKSSRLILEQVPIVRENILRAKDWQSVADKQKKTYFGKAVKQLAADRLQSMMKALDFMCAMEPEPVRSNGDRQGGEQEQDDITTAPILVSCSRKVRDGVWEPWCSFTCSISTDKPPEPVTITSDGDQGSVVQGNRYRLQPMTIDDTRPLPSNGKVVVRHHGRSSEALLQLPVIPVRSCDEGPAALWLTVGLLAADGFALQLKLKKAEKPKERDKIEGVWYAYHPVGGAITIQQS